MALETVKIKNDTYRIHQDFPSYGIDAIGNPMFLGDDYLDPELLSFDKNVSQDDQICYTFEVTEKDFDGFQSCFDITQSEDLFIAFCVLEIEDNKNPTGVIHKNGDKWDNSLDNLAWNYCIGD